MTREAASGVDLRAAAAAAIVERTRREQGKPLTVTDPAAIARLAQLLAPSPGFDRVPRRRAA